MLTKGIDGLLHGPRPLVRILGFFYEGAKRVESSRGFRNGAKPSRPPVQRYPMSDIDDFAAPGPSPISR